MINDILIAIGAFGYLIVFILFVVWAIKMITQSYRDRSKQRHDEYDD